MVGKWGWRVTRIWFLGIKGYTVHMIPKIIPIDWELWQIGIGG